MSDENFNNNDEQKPAPQVAKISLDELNEIKKTIAPVRSEAELEMLRENPDIDPNTVYSAHKVNNNEAELDFSNLNSEVVGKNEVYQTNSTNNESVAEVKKVRPVEEVKPQTEESKEVEKAPETENNVNKNQSFDLFASIMDELNNITIVPRNKNEEVVSEPVQNAQVITEQQKVPEIDNSVQDNDIEVQEEKHTEEAEAEETKVAVVDVKNDEMEHGLFGKRDNQIVDTSKIPSDNTEALKAEAEAPKTTKVDMSEIKAMQAQMQMEKESGTGERKSIKEIMAEINKTGQENDENADADYDKNLDFEKVTDIKKFKLPVRKLPIILSLVFILLAAVGFVVFNYVMENQKNQVYLAKTELNIHEITGGYVGEKVDLSGIYIIQTYSDGSRKYIYDINKYITTTSSTINKTDLTIKSASEASWVRFVVGDEMLTLTTRTIDKVPVEITEFRLAMSSVSVGDEIRFDQILAKVNMGEYGTKLLNLDEIRLNLNIIYDGTMLSKSASGFVIGSFVDGSTNKFTVRYREGTYAPVEIIITLVVN